MSRSLRRCLSREGIRVFFAMILVILNADVVLCHLPWDDFVYYENDDYDEGNP